MPNSRSPLVRTCWLVFGSVALYVTAVGVGFEHLYRVRQDGGDAAWWNCWWLVNLVVDTDRIGAFSDFKPFADSLKALLAGIGAAAPFFLEAASSPIAQRFSRWQLFALPLAIICWLYGQHLVGGYSFYQQAASEELLPSGTFDVEPLDGGIELFLGVLIAPVAFMTLAIVVIGRFANFMARQHARSRTIAGAERVFWTVLSLATIYSSLACVGAINLYRYYGKCEADLVACRPDIWHLFTPADRIGALSTYDPLRDFGGAALIGATAAGLFIRRVLAKQVPQSSWETFSICVFAWISTWIVLVGHDFYIIAIRDGLHNSSLPAVIFPLAGFVEIVGLAILPPIGFLLLAIDRMRLGKILQLPRDNERANARAPIRLLL
jgi:hypothetical protein